jgi:hypothetical protein
MIGLIINKTCGYLSLCTVSENFQKYPRIILTQTPPIKIIVYIVYSRQQQNKLIMTTGIKRLSFVKNTAYIIQCEIGSIDLCMSKGGIVMDGTIAGVLNLVISKKRNTDVEKSLLIEIETVRQNLETVSAHFEYQNDPDLIDACIYETKALTARYSYLIREAKKLGITKNVGCNLEHTTHS